MYFVSCKTIKAYCLQVNIYGKSPVLNHSTSSESVTVGKEAAFILWKNIKGQKKRAAELFLGERQESTHKNGLSIQQPKIISV